MPAHRTSLSALELLVAIETHGSISASAQALGLAQPTVSTGIRSLERALGLHLVERSARGSSLTDDGVAVAAWAREVLDASDRFEASAAALRGEGSVHLVLAASMTIAESLVPSWLAAWRRSTARRRPGGATADHPPRPAIELLVRNSTQVMHAVLGHEAELGFIEGRGILPGLRDRVVAQDELVVVVAPPHPWARRRGPVDAATLASGPLVLREKGSGTREVLEQALAAAGTALPVDLPQLGSTAAIKAAVQEGDAVGVVSRLAVVTDLEQHRMVAVPTTGLDLRRQLRLVTRVDRQLTPAARDLAAVIRSAGGSR